ncbi:hypothetical protein HELRODRAFT_195129 [Helobdella robusta]|uniref:Vang-like protein n=1 Tax=Helobdella robusta TaxID=6412 RepID=T1FWS3_HELRO|nr:hypothetical protein HELRODRAFT_195129 [Helobdella robusta]ESN99675.1 hypothetical protein HELRODRAFT_195129 [Helobdella robusta]
MENESVISARSDRSRSSHHSHHRNSSNRVQQYYNRTRNSRAGVSGDALLRYPVESEQPEYRDDRSAVSTSGRLSKRHNKHGGMMMSEFIPERRSLRAYEDQCDNVTVITGATSDFVYSMDDLNKDHEFNSQKKNSFSHRKICNKFISFITICFVVLLCLSSFFSPILMLLLPKLPMISWEIDLCDPECESAFLGIGFKLLILLIATWALFFRRSRVNFPRLDPGRTLIVFITFLLTFSFWLFYGIRLFQKPDVTYLGIISFTTSHIDSLLFVHYLSVIILEINHLQCRFAVKIVRSPDGHSKTYTVGKMRIQNLAQWCLDKYYTDFQSYNPYLEISSIKKNSTSSGPPTAFKLYNLDGAPTGESEGGNGNNNNGGGAAGGKTFSVVSSSVAGGRVGHNDRYYGEIEQEKRVSRRRSRLMMAAEEAFSHVRRIRNSRVCQMTEVTTTSTMSAREAAQAIFPTLVRPLQKYLRITRQQPKYNMEDVVGHLTRCISYELSYKAFLERYLSQNEVAFVNDDWILRTKQQQQQPNDGNNTKSANIKSKKSQHSWVISCESLLNRMISEDGCHFKLGRDVLGGESLFISVQKLPFYDIMEEPVNIKMQRFNLDMNVELSV